MEIEQTSVGAIPLVNEQEPEVLAFLSYDRPLLSFASSLATNLDAERVRLRGDWQLEPGADWWDRIADLIRGSDTFLFLLTPESVRSAACIQELDLALSWQKRILPAVREQPSDDALVDLPEVLAKKHWVFVRPQDDLSEAIASIVTAVRTDFELATIHTRLTISADAWEKRVGDLLRGTYLEEAKSALTKMDKRKPLLPSASPKMRLFVDESQAAERRRKGLGVFATLATIIIAGLLGWIAWQRLGLAQARLDAESQRAAAQEKRAYTEKLRGLGESAVAATRGGDMPKAVGLLEEVVTGDPAGELSSYHVLHRFLRPLLMPASKIVSQLARPSVFRWRGKDFAVLPNGQYTPLTGAAIATFAVAGHGRYLITTDVARSVCIFGLPEFSRIQCIPIYGVRIQGIYEHPKNGALAIIASELTAPSADDEWSDDKRPDEGDPFMVLLSRPDGKPLTIDARRFKAEEECRTQKDAPCGFNRLAEPNVHTLTFPHLRPEAEYWLTAVSSVVPAGWSTSAAEQSDFDDNRARHLNLSDARYSKNSIRIAAADMLSPQFFMLGGSEYMTTQAGLGAYQGIYVCNLASIDKVDECWDTYVSGLSTVVLAPDHQHLAILSPTVEDGFQILELPSLTRCTGFDGPLERALDAAFHSDGKRLSVATRDGELWTYSIDSGCKVTLQHKSFNSQLASWAVRVKPQGSGPKTLAVTFVSDRDVIVTYKDKDVMDVDATNGVGKWVRSGLGPFSAGSISVAPSSDGRLLAVWKATEIQLIHTETGILLSSSLGPGPRPVAKGEITRIAWAGESIIAEWNAKVPGSNGRALLRRLSPEEAESEFLPGVPTSSLINLPPA
jgi:hypothetical protein